MPLITLSAYITILPGTHYTSKQTLNFYEICYFYIIFIISSYVTTPFQINPFLKLPNFHILSLIRKTYKVLVTHSCPLLCNPMDYSPPASSVHGILQARILEWFAIPFSRGSPTDWTQVSCIAGGFFTIWATREAQEKHIIKSN